jgi:hypothetical protein
MAERAALIAKFKPKVKLGKKKTFYIIGTPKKIVFTKLKGRGDAREFYIAEAYVRHPHKWDTTVYGPAALDNLSLPQLKACEALADKSKALAGISRLQRKVALSKVLKGKSYGGVVKKAPRKPVIPPAELEAKIRALA